MKVKQLNYVLITPARNEEEFIEQTIRSVIKQTVKPLKWVIVSDGSTDKTDEIVLSYTLSYNWIKLIRMPEHEDRQFAAKVFAFNTGYDEIKSLEYDVIGNLDADISFDKDYFQYLLDKFSEIPELGVAGTPFIEDSSQVYNYKYTNINHVSGQCQLFHRECFEDIGGYIPIKGGGIDWTAVTTARMKGWTTRTFLEKKFFHHRRMGTGDNSPIIARFKQGQKDYYLGNHPLWEVARCVYQMTKKPYITGGSVIFWGYVYAFIIRMKRPIPIEVLKFNRKEQLKRLFNRL